MKGECAHITKLPFIKSFKFFSQPQTSLSFLFFLSGVEINKGLNEIFFSIQKYLFELTLKVRAQGQLFCIMNPICPRTNCEE